jgi:aminopeptidase N
MRKALVGAALLVCVFVMMGGVAVAAGFTPGAPGVGDPFFPLAGNGGYDVTHYGLTLAYVPATNQLKGHAVITATATQDLAQFDLDLRGFSISKVRVDGQPAPFVRFGQELVITPATGHPSGTPFRVRVDYAGAPSVVNDQFGGIEGWVPTDDGAFVVGEPQGSPAWYPVNDTPRDKATFDFAVTVSRGLTVMANGILVSHTVVGARTTWRWHEGDPMAPYLATATLGRFDLKQYTVDGVPAYVAVDSKLRSRKALATLPAIVRFFASIYGPYPFDAVGAVVDRAPRVGYFLETQTKPVFCQMPDEVGLAHEFSHMWFGDSVTLSQWPDIWLHEGFATWSEWIWSAHEGHKSADSFFKMYYKTPADNTSFWNPPPGDPGTCMHLFDSTIYYRGAMTLQALCEKVGNATFFDIMRAWAQDNRYGNVTTPEFIALAEQQSGMDLTGFFQAWLYQKGKPTSW